MRRIANITTFAMSISLSSAGAAQQLEHSPDAVDTEIISLTEAGVDEQIILTRVRSYSCDEKISAERIIALSQSGVSARVIQTLVRECENLEETSGDQVENSAENTLNLKEPLILWGKVEAGMSRADVEALYPEQRGVIKHKRKQTEIEDVAILEGCEAEVEIQYEDDIVDAVKVKGRSSMGGRCSDKVFAALGARYGQPDVQRDSQASILETEGAISVWNRDGVTLRFKRKTNGAFGGAGLLTASWEIWYTASAQQINL